MTHLHSHVKRLAEAHRATHPVIDDAVSSAVLAREAKAATAVPTSPPGPAYPLADPAGDTDDAGATGERHR